MQLVEYKFSQILRYMGIPKEQIRMDASFSKDFDFEEFQFTCLVYYIGAYFQINVYETDINELNTVGSAMNFVKKKLDIN